MKKNIFLTLLSISIFFISCSNKENISFQLKPELSKTLLVLDDALINLQIKDSTQTDFGSIKCPHCNILHTRAAEAVYPLTIGYKITNDNKYLHSAISLGNWLIELQEKDGSWKETPEEWTGTTTDQLLMLLLSYPILENHLSQSEKEKWQSSMKGAADYLTEVMSPEFASINYVATTTATLSVVYKLFNDEKYLNKATSLAHRTISKMDEDGFIEGEGGRSLNNKYGVDLGYDMEMSLWGLGYYAKLTNDAMVNDYVKKALANHIYFVYPDGSLDNSWGIRSNKWTNFGSATSDGMQVLMALYKDENPIYANASKLNLEFLRKNIRDGIVSYGSLYWEIFDNPPCIYPTFAKAKNLAMAYELDNDQPSEIKNIPTQNKNWLKQFNTLNVTMVRTENIVSTITAYNYKDYEKVNKSKYMFRPAGGSISNLWIENHGYLQAGSQTEYHRWEPMHFPEAENVKALTPRIELITKGDYFTNLFEFDARINSEKLSDNNYQITTNGELKNKKWEAIGIAYKLTHTFTSNSIIKNIELRYHDYSDTVYIVEPIIDYPNMDFKKLDANSVSIKSPNKNFEFILKEGDYEIIIGKDKENYWSPYPALRAYPIVIVIPPNQKGFINNVEFEIKIK
ncbi:MAG: hypothetical protein H6609_14975 [Ignavibacteriales bacterium]|nr:hypothetical protein [Ignavibacteriales bacterium]